MVLASGVCSLVGGFGPGACAGLLVEGSSACSLLSGAGSCLSVGRTVSREVFKGNCGLTKTLNSLPADG